MKKHFFFGLALLVVLFDQITKYYIRTEVTAIQLIPNIFHFTFTKNTGASFGMFSGNNMVFLIISLGAAIGISAYYLLKKIPQHYQLFVSLILGGTVGNLIDRIYLGYVVDFVDFRIWPVFNVADAAISIGAIGLIYYIMKEK